MAKWASRFALGLSNSVPGWKLQLSQIRFADDISMPLNRSVDTCHLLLFYSLANLKTGSNMTDGAGSINRHCLRELRHRYDWEEKPTAIQVRLFGAKVKAARGVQPFCSQHLRVCWLKITIPLRVPL